MGAPPGAMPGAAPGTVPGQAPGGVPGASQPGVAGASPGGGVQVAMAGGPKPGEKHRIDPFAMLARAKPKVRIVYRERVPYPTWLIVPRKATENGNAGAEVEQVDQTPRRMAGVLYNGTVSAILETGTTVVVVKPGDLVENQTMRVEKVEPNRIVLKTLTGPKPRYVEVKMAAAQVQYTGVEASTGVAPSEATSGGGRPPYVPMPPSSGRPGGGRPVSGRPGAGS